jgi:hypothetical protein
VLTPSAFVPNYPSKTSDLLTIVENDLVRWDYVTNFMVPLVQGVIDFSVSADGNRIVLLRFPKVTANGKAIFDIDVLDLKSKKIQNLRKGLSAIHHLLLSPDGRWLAYQQDADEKYIIGIQLSLPDNDIKIGLCDQPDNEPCSSISWSPDSQVLLWEDRHGIWMSQLSKNEPKLISSHKIQFLDPKGHSSSVDVSFGDFFWSPKGRFLLTQITTRADVVWFSVFDTRTGKWYEVPDTFRSSAPISSDAVWTQDGDLMVIRVDYQTRAYLRINYWKINPAREELFFAGNQTLLFDPSLPKADIEKSNNPDLLVHWAYQASEDILCFAVVALDSSITTTLYWIKLDQEIILYANPLTLRSDFIVWSNDSYGAILINFLDGAHFASQDGQKLLELPFQALRNPENFYWLPPAPRS